MPPDAYAEIVDLYDLEHADYTDDIELLIELADLGEGPILELGTGTGRVLLPLADAGFAVTGVDSSQPMLDVAVARAQAAGLDVALHHGDMTGIGAIPGGPFGMIIASLNSIMHLNAEGQRAMVTSAHAALAPRGRLVIDTLNPSITQLNHLLNTTHLEGSWQLEQGSPVDKWGHRRSGTEPQEIDTLIWYDRVRTDGTVHRTRTRFTLRYVHQSELALLLEIAGFTHVDWYGSYELDAWEPDSDRIIAVAHKDET
jgi:SAM-dependent methyltransferase